ncbi:hypothetical protein THARTR1_01171 [Trichoderma harzianum]|uniref:PHD-type domain-containing protein n=1 Tax=Trichoderma harzianum TaxID=5544 RepID=A0A2K0UMB1_TRIHA|nr:hypothetical protein THARTR1_01171 [Trichoderma harzianum]
MHELNSVMPTGHRVEVIDALTVRFLAPDSEPTIIQVGMSNPLTTGLDYQPGLDMGPLQQGKSMSEAPNGPTLANQSSSEAAITQEKGTCSQQSFQEQRQNMMTADQKSILAPYAQPTESHRTADYPVIDTPDAPELTYDELNKVAVSQINPQEMMNNQVMDQASPQVMAQMAQHAQQRVMQQQQQQQQEQLQNSNNLSAHLQSQSVPLSHTIDDHRSRELGSKIDSEDGDEDFGLGDSDNRNDGAQRFIDSPRMSDRLIEILQDAQNGTRSTETAYTVAKEFISFSLNSDLMDEFQRELTKVDTDVIQGLRSALDDISEASGKAIETEGDNVKTQEVVATVKDKNGPNDPNEPQYCLCNKGSTGIMIRCDNVDSCKYKWFHLECVGLTVAPSSKDKWYCPDCRGHVNIGEKADINPQALPPDSGNPEYAMDTEVSTGEGSTDHLSDARANLAYLDELAKFHKQQGNILFRLPYVDKKPVDLYRLRKAVESRGGFDMVCKLKKWAEIAKDLGYNDSGGIMLSLSTSLKNSFLRWISPYEEYLRVVKPGDDHQLEEEKVEPRDKGKIASIGRINYPSPNPDIYIWPPEPNVPGEEEGEPAGSPTVPPPLPPPVMAASGLLPKGSDDPELSSPSSDSWRISDGEYPSHEPFLARPRPDIYTKQLPPISGVSEGSNSAQVDSLVEISNSQASPTRSPSSSASESSLGPGDVSLSSVAEPSGDGIGLQQFASIEGLTRHDERPEKSPIETSEYDVKEFIRKYDKKRHHTHVRYKGAMVCGFCPGSGTATEKSFTRADVFKRHLIVVHGVQQTPPDSHTRASGAVAPKTLAEYAPDATGKCSNCPQIFANAQDFYEHLDDCVLRNAHMKALSAQGM